MCLQISRCLFYFAFKALNGKKQGGKNERYTKSDGYVFINLFTGDKLKDIKKAWGEVLKDAGIENFRFHDLRHTFASKLAMNGVDLNAIRELLGHSDMSMVLRYAHLSPEHLKKAVEQLGKSV